MANAPAMGRAGLWQVEILELLNAGTHDDVTKDRDLQKASDDVDL